MKEEFELFLFERWYHAHGDVAYWSNYDAAKSAFLYGFRKGEQSAALEELSKLEEDYVLGGTD